MTSVSEIVFADYFSLFEFGPCVIGKLAQVCRAFAVKAMFTTVSYGNVHTLTVCGADIMTVMISGSVLAATYEGMVEVLSYGSFGNIPRINLDSRRTDCTAIRLYNGILCKVQPLLIHALNICNISYETITVNGKYIPKSHPPRRAHTVTVEGKDTKICDILCSRGYHCDTTAIIRTNCRNNTIKIGKTRIRCGRIRLNLGGNGLYRYLLGMDLFTSHWSPKKIAERNEVLMSMLLVVE